jgi:septum formation protein
MTMQIILASKSPYRIAQLKDFGLKFRALRPTIDEEQMKAYFFRNMKRPLKRGQTIDLHLPHRLSRYLAAKKAESLALKYPDHVIVAADQLVNFNGEVMGKPKSPSKAEAMLRKMSGKPHELITSLCVISHGKVYRRTVTARIHLRKLSDEEIKAYVKRDNPVDCAGSYKFELSGLSLVERMSVTDPSSLIGLPLMALYKILRQLGDEIPFR